MSYLASNFIVMTNMRFPKLPAQVCRETTAGVVAYNFGIALRIIWEVAKPIMKWAAIIAVLSFVWMVSLIWHLVFATTKS